MTLLTSIGWCDRKVFKQNIINWLEKNNNFLVLSIPDIQEARDISKWIKDKAQNFSIGTAIFDSDLEIEKNNLLEQIMNSFGEYKKYDDRIFIDYYSLLKEAGSTPFFKDYKQSVKQEIAPLSKVIGDASYEGIIQNTQINNIISMSLSHKALKETSENKLLTEFINDIRNIKNPLLLIRFGENGFDDFTSEFKNWFLNHFCRKLLLENVKICILTHGNLEKFSDFDEEQNQEVIPESIYFDDIVDDLKQRIGNFNPYYRDFAPVIVDDNNNKIQYKTYKRKLSALIKSNPIYAQ